MTAAQQTIKGAIEEAQRLQKALSSGHKQVRSDDEKDAIRATTLAWFNNHRPILSAVLTDDVLSPLDEGYKGLLQAASRATLRRKYIDGLKRIRKALTELQVTHVLVLSGAPASRQEPSSDTPPRFSPLIGDPAMQTILARRWLECVACLDANAPLAATVMMGGILEGLLLARINQLADKSPVFAASSAPRDRKSGKTLQLKEWGLKNYIDVAHELGWISKTTKDIGVVVRDYRNFIHPQKEHSHGIHLALEDARMMWEVAKSVAHQVLKP